MGRSLSPPGLEETPHLTVAFGSNVFDRFGLGWIFASGSDPCRSVGRLALPHLWASRPAPRQPCSSWRAGTQWWAARPPAARRRAASCCPTAPPPDAAATRRRSAAGRRASGLAPPATRPGRIEYFQQRRQTTTLSIRSFSTGGSQLRGWVSLNFFNGILQYSQKKCWGLLLQGTYF